tara:strand:+ start:62 stop:844 length:783 start_codon:yes stop_codon:yes gene_type:complete
LKESFEREKWLKWQSKICKRLAESDSLSPERAYQIASEEFPRARVTLFAGMKRSGNHAIINWVVQNNFESLVYANNIVGVGPDSWHVYDAEYILPRMIDRLLLSVEHCPVSDYSMFDPILIARDPYNWLASWISHTHFNLENLERDIEVYIENLSCDTPVISFNDWFSHRSYRDRIGQQLGIVNTDASINGVTSFGKGSSFDKKSFDGKAQQMKVLQRWSRMTENKTYRDAIKNYDTEFRDICREYFPDISPDQITKLLL